MRQAIVGHLILKGRAEASASSVLPQPSKPYMGLTALVYLSLAQGPGGSLTGTGRGMFRDHSRHKHFRGGRKDLGKHFSTGEQYLSQRW